MLILLLINQHFKIFKNRTSIVNFRFKRIYVLYIFLNDFELEQLLIVPYIQPNH